MNPAAASTANPTLPATAQLIANIARLRGMLARPAAFAAGAQRRVFRIAMLALIAGAWLAFFYWKRAAPDIRYLAISALVALLPGAILFFAQRLLHDFSGMPERLDAYAASIDAQNEAYRQAREAIPALRRIRLADAFNIVKSARSIWDIVGESRELVSLLGQSLAVLNPMFWIAVVAAAVMSFALALGALVTLLVFLV